jgi:protein phosphatase
MARLHMIEDLDAVVRPLLQESTGCSKSVQEELVEDALWSDPAEHDDDPVLQAAGGVAYNAERKTAWSFAPSVVRDFCERNGVSAVVRAHQVPLDGVELFAGGLGVTVFSAANYPEDSDRASNNHAGLLWMGRDGRLHARLLPPQPRVSSA